MQLSLHKSISEKNTWTMEAETLTNVLPNEILLHIFRLLDDDDDLIRAEQVCQRWKTVVEMYFATEKHLKFWFFPENYSKSIEWIRRYGPSVQTLALRWPSELSRTCEWAEEIANRFPNLLSMKLDNFQITNDNFQCISTKCCQLKNVNLKYCNFTDEGLRYILRALPGLKSLKMKKYYCPRFYQGDRFPEHGISEKDLLPQADATAVFCMCPSLEAFAMSDYECSDNASFSRFCKECVTLRKLVIECSDMPKETFEQIQNCSLLEELKLFDCPNIDNLTLIQISKGCPNLRSVSLWRLPLTSDEGLKCFARSRNLSSFEAINEKMTDVTLVELAKCNLRQMTIFSELITDQGCAAVLAHCPQLKVLDVSGCVGLSNATVESAIKAVQCRNNGLVLELRVEDTDIDTFAYENCHPLLRVLWE